MKHNLIKNSAISLSLILGISTICNASEASEIKVNGILKFGVLASTSPSAKENPLPFLMHIENSENPSLEGQPLLKGAALLGECYGDFASSRAMCRIQTLSFVKASGEVVEQSVDGFLVDEEGERGIKGKVLDLLESERETQSQTLLNYLKEEDGLKNEADKNTPTAFQKIMVIGQQIHRLEAMSPSIEISAGREVTVVFKRASDLGQIK